PSPTKVAMKPICLFLFRGDAARRSRATVKRGRRTTTGPPQSSSKSESEQARRHECDHIATAIISPGVSTRTSVLPVLIAPKILHGSEPRCDDMVRYTEWARRV